MKQRGFTLIEILISISIIALLSSVIFYSVTEAKLKGEDSKRVSQVRETTNAIELYKSNNNGEYPFNNEGPGLYAEGSVTYNASMQKLVDAGTFPEIPKSSNGSSYYYQQNDDNSGSLIAVLDSSKAQTEFDGCVSSEIESDCSYDTETNVVEDKEGTSRFYNLGSTSSDDGSIPEGEGVSDGTPEVSSLCGVGHNNPHADYSPNHSEACESGSTIISVNGRYNNTDKTQWLEWVCRDNSDSLNTETCLTNPETSTPPSCGNNTTVDFPSYYSLPSESQTRTSNEDEYCSPGLYRPGATVRSGGRVQYQWYCEETKYSSTGMISCSNLVNW